MKSLIVIPGAAPHWVAGHGRDLAHRLADHGSVTVAFTSRVRSVALPGQCSGSSVLGHARSGRPIWTGRAAVALGLRSRRDLSVVVLWPGANRLVALCAAAIARIRGELVVLDVVDDTPGRSRLLRRLLERVADVAVRRDDPPVDGDRVVLVNCGRDADLAALALTAADGMADDAARVWSMQIHVSPGALPVAGPRMPQRHGDRVRVCEGDPSQDDLRRADAVVSAMGTTAADASRTAVLTGGAGILVGHAVAERVPLSHDGVWFARRDPASFLVALEASTGVLRTSPVPVAVMRDWATEVIATAVEALGAPVTTVAPVEAVA